MALLALSLSACGTTGQQVLENAQGCKRDYKGAISAGLLGGANFAGTVDIHCEPKPTALAVGSTVG